MVNNGRYLEIPSPIHIKHHHLLGIFNPPVNQQFDLGMSRGLEE